MKRIVLSLLIPISCCLTAWGQKNNICPMGDYKLQATQDPTKEQVGEASSSWQLSYDPNEIIGPEGYDSVRWVSINDVLNYTILFENDPEFATAAAQKVDIRFDFPSRSAQGDASLAKKAWMKGFGIGGYSFSNMSWTVAKPSNAYQQRIDLKDSLGYYVDLIAGLDVARQQGFWTFSTIDPETGYAPWQAERGLLPVNDSTHIGEGFVTFLLKPYEGLKTGDTISIQANIVFDQNDSIPTNRWCNKIDAGNPKSKVTAELHPTLPNVYNLKFTGKDDEGGSGVKHLLLYLANHNGIYEEIDTIAVDTVFAFPVEGGKQYKLYSIAVDNTGNREPAKMEPDVILNFNQAPTDIALSNSTFQDDLEAGGFIGKLTSVDTEEEKTFTYALAEGDGAIHNDLFQITEDRLEIKNSFKCADGECYNVRISTTDGGGMSFSKSFELNLKKVLAKPEVKTLEVSICEGETYLFHGEEYGQTGKYQLSKENDYMCDSVFVLNLTVLPIIETPLVTIEGSCTLVSSAAKGNQWFNEEGTPVEGATEQKFTPEEDGIYYVAVSNGVCYSNPSQSYRVVLTDEMDLTLDLQKGWNWVSSNLTGETMQNAKQFITPIEEYTSRLVGINSELINDPQYGLVGNLTTLEPQQGYKINVTQAINNTWSGQSYRPETTTIKLHKGWNWIGYVPTAKQGLADALSNLEASENAVIKCEDDFATFANGNWMGSLEELCPGKGYMYYADKATTYTYPATRVFTVTNNQGGSQWKTARDLAPWNYNEYDYPDNMTMIARLNVNGNQTVEGAYSVGAFSGTECRGVGKNVNGLLFITIHGSLSDDDVINFKAVENLTGNELDINESVKFNGQHAGTIANPFILNARGETNDIGNIDVDFNIYPKPLRSKLFINGPTGQIKTVCILAANGKTIITTNGYNDEGIDVSMLAQGIYVVALMMDNGQIKYEKVMKANN